MFIFSGFHQCYSDLSAQQVENMPDVLEIAEYIRVEVAPIVDVTRVHWDEEQHAPALFEYVVAEGIGMWIIDYYVNNSKSPSNYEIMEKSKELADF